MIGIILCGGYGKKIWPYSDWWQKCCIPIGNRPNVARVAGQLRDAGLTRIYAVIGYNSQMVRYALRDEPGVVVLEGHPGIGTASSALSCADGLGEDMLVIYGDAVVHEDDVASVVRKFSETGHPVALTETLGEKERSLDWICAMVDDDRIQAIYGHPRSHYVNARVGGVFALPKDAIRYLAANPGHMENVCVGGMPPKESQLEQSVQMMIEDGHPVVSVEARRPVVDIDKPWHIWEANVVAAAEALSSIDESFVGEGASIDSSADIRGRVRLGRGSKIGRNVIIKGDVFIGDDVLVDSGAIIEDNVMIGDRSALTDYCMIGSGSVIGRANRIGYNAQFQGVTFDNVSMVHNCEIYGVVGSHTDIAAGCLVGSLRFDDTGTVHTIEGRKENAGVFANAAFIGDHTRTGVGNIFFPGVKVGVNCAIYPGVVVDSDVPSNSLLSVEQSRTLKRWGPEKYGW